MEGVWHLLVGNSAVGIGLAGLHRLEVWGGTVKQIWKRMGFLPLRSGLAHVPADPRVGWNVFQWL